MSKHTEIANCFLSIQERERERERENEKVSLIICGTSDESAAAKEAETKGPKVLSGAGTENNSKEIL